MHGLVNNAFRDLIRFQFDEETWNRICAHAGVDGAELSCPDSCPDELTDILLRTASEELGIPVTELLVALGEHWLSFTAERGYEKLVARCGTTLAEFLRNVENLFTGLWSLMPELGPPTFEFESEEAGAGNLHYRSERAIFAPMVKGMLLSLARRFDREAEVHWIPSGDSGEDHEIFEIRCRVSTR